MRYVLNVSKSTPFDNTTNGFDSTNAQDAIEEASIGHTGLQQAVCFVIGSTVKFICFDDLVDTDGNPLSRVIA